MTKKLRTRMTATKREFVIKEKTLSLLIRCLENEYISCFVIFTRTFHFAVPEFFTKIVMTAWISLAIYPGIPLIK